MGQLLHKCARTTQNIRRDIQNSQESIKTLASKYSINPKTVAKWKNRDHVTDVSYGPKNPRSTVLTTQEEAIIVAFRKHTLLPIDDCLYSLQETIPNLTRSSLHRCLQRHGISKLPKEESKPKQKKKFKEYKIGYFHIDIAEVNTEEGRLYLFVAIDRVSKYAYAELYSSASKTTAAEFLRNLIKIVPYKIHTVLTDNGSQFTNRPKDKHAFHHIFDRVCDANKTEHKLTKVAHPWTNGQVERMNRTLKEATVKKYHYISHNKLKEHLHSFLMAYNHAKRLKAIKGKTPYEFIIDVFTKEHKLFRINPYQNNVGLNKYKSHVFQVEEIEKFRLFMIKSYIKNVTLLNDFSLKLNHLEK